jgi:hypothetical protein
MPTSEQGLVIPCKKETARFSFEPRAEVFGEEDRRDQYLRISGPGGAIITGEATGPASR